MRILLFSLKQSIFLDTSGFIKVLATLELQTEAPRAHLCPEKYFVLDWKVFSSHYATVNIEITIVKWRAENFVSIASLSQNIFHMGYGIPKIIPFPVRLPLIL